MLGDIGAAASLLLLLLLCFRFPLDQSRPHRVPSAVSIWCSSSRPQNGETKKRASEHDMDWRVVSMVLRRGKQRFRIWKCPKVDRSCCWENDAGSLYNYADCAFLCTLRKHVWIMTLPTYRTRRLRPAQVHARGYRRQFWVQFRAWFASLEPEMINPRSKRPGGRAGWGLSTKAIQNV